MVLSSNRGHRHHRSLTAMEDMMVEEITVEIAVAGDGGTEGRFVQS